MPEKFFKLSTVAAAINPEHPKRAVETIRMWLHRGIISWSAGDPEQGVPADQAPKKAGSMGKISWYRANQFAFTFHLAGIGISLADAGRLALEFSDKGSGEGRRPSELFPQGDTALILWRGDDKEWCGKVCNLLPETNTVGQVFASFGAKAPSGFWVIDCRPISQSLSALKGA